jgi:rubrerythrin
MDLAKESRMDARTALKSAMLNEWDGLHFYTRAARQISDARGKRMIETLIADERVHIGVIAAQYDAISSGKGWLALADAKKECRLPDVARKFGVKPGATCEGLERIFPSGAKAARVLRSIRTDTEALHLALDFEKKGYQAYKAAAASLDDAAGKEALEWLAGEENEHFRLLDSAIEYLDGNGLWWDREYMAPLEG